MLKQLNEIAKMIVRNENEKGIINIGLVTDNQIKKLNNKYRNKNKATDVLSFYMGEDGILGDVIISKPTALRNAGIFKVKEEDELRRLVIHGTLHLLGYDHTKKADRIIMEKKEDFYAKKIL